MAASFFFLFFFSFSSSPATLVSERLWRPAAQQHPKFLKHYPQSVAIPSFLRNNPSRRPISPRSARHPGLRTLNTQQARRDDDETGAVQNKHSATSP
ncbi:uncharacterized protein GLRG_01698 [Colletotrichum graminicola M1.001]|uniref:Secreted protein n=1 Tax=Colletotrichum graminicola (strain M1.001 / M2 / FGSC 10212) TaxID=645133 RepID=E3Q5R3_COLGM|nr:uncharacterized protein GLRG_01698 [Colletotrichum graminicola M1.001]EFQ26554.1 hypothetical protein GLRG_01698 [Colletotrichum graminicola M1.001]